MQLAPTRERAARALAKGDALGALALVGRDDTPLGLALRGVAYAQMGDLGAARALLERAERSLEDALARARVRAALVEITLEEGDAASAARRADEVAAELDRLGDARNAAMQRLVAARADVLLGRPAGARHRVDALLSTDLPADLRAVAALARAEIAVREVRPTRARVALVLALRFLEASPNALLGRALDALDQELTRPIARLVDRGKARPCDLFDVERAASGEALLVDACRRTAVVGLASIPLARRPVLFALLVALALAWPDDVPRDELAARAFDTRVVNESHRARLRVEIGRLRKLLSGMGELVATQEGYELCSALPVLVLLPPTDDEAARVAILLGDGASWSAQELAEHIGISTRTVQRALAKLVESGRVSRTGKARGVRYASSSAPIASRLLLLGLVPTT